MGRRTVFFDLDGTIVDHFAAIHRAHTHTIKQLGLPPPTMDQVRDAIGAGVEVAIARLAGPENVRRALAIYRPYWDATMLDDVSLFPGTRELLQALHDRGDQPAVLTNKHGPSSRRICEHLGIAPLLAGNFGATDTPWLKPQRELVDYALAKLGADRADALLIGDSIYDVQTGHNGGFPCWCVTTGTHTEAQLRTEGADRIFPDLFAVTRAVGV